MMHGQKDIKFWSSVSSVFPLIS